MSPQIMETFAGQLKRYSNAERGAPNGVAYGAYRHRAPVRGAYGGGGAGIASLCHCISLRRYPGCCDISYSTMAAAQGTAQWGGGNYPDRYCRRFHHCAACHSHPPTRRAVDRGEPPSSGVLERDAKGSELAYSDTFNRAEG